MRCCLLQNLKARGIRSIAPFDGPHPIFCSPVRAGVHCGMVVYTTSAPSIPLYMSGGSCILCAERQAKAS
jgi:hypothetical protein